MPKKNIFDILSDAVDNINGKKDDSAQSDNSNNDKDKGGLGGIIEDVIDAVKGNKNNTPSNDSNNDKDKGGIGGIIEDVIDAVKGNKRSTPTPPADTKPPVADSSGRVRVTPKKK